MPANTTELEKRLWGAADELRANSKLKSSEYSVPVLGLIFLRYADHKFAKAKAKLTSQGSGRRTIGRADYQAQGVLYLPESARFSNLLQLPGRCGHRQGNQRCYEGQASEYHRWTHSLLFHIHRTLSSPASPARPYRR
jgi:type I restriction-modification system DNA methylase subunit